MPAGMKQSKVMYYLPGIIVICIGFYVLTIETPDTTIRFGADFYTETYQAIAEIAHLIKVVTGSLLIALGIISVGKGAADAGRCDLMLGRLDALEKAIAESAKNNKVSSESSELPAVDLAPTPAEPEVFTVEPVDTVADGQPVGPEPPAEMVESQSSQDAAEENAPVDVDA